MGWKISDWFGGGKEALADAVEYKGFNIQPQPRQSDGHWRTAGVISKCFAGGEIKEHHYIRAETHGARADADEFSIIKGRQIVDDFGDRMFDEG